MAVSSPISAPVSPARGAGIRLPLAGIPLAADAVAVGAAAALVGPRSLWTTAWAAAALAGLRGASARRIHPRVSDDAPWLVAAIALPLSIVAAAAGHRVDLARFVLLGPVAIALALSLRGVAYRLMAEARARGILAERTLVAGAGLIGTQVAQTLLDHPAYGLRPIGFLDVSPAPDLPLPVLGAPADLADVVRRRGVSRVIVAFGRTREAELVGVLRTCGDLPVEVHVVPRFFELGAAEGRSVDDLWGIPLVRLRRSAFRTIGWRAKRALDVALASAGLIATAPIFATAAVAVRISSPGPVLFRQKRVGQNGVVFELLKLRTMHVNDDSDTTWSVADDHRVTRIGRLLRAAGIDEIPQLVNVLRGDMSLVGPRPERPHFVDRFNAEVPSYDDRHRAPVGITGWAQVHGLRGDTSIGERVRFDNHYIENWSLWRDVVIMARTIRALTGGRST